MRYSNGKIQLKNGLQDGCELTGMLAVMMGKRHFDHWNNMEEQLDVDKHPHVVAWGQYFDHQTREL